MSTARRTHPPRRSPSPSRDGGESRGENKGHNRGRGHGRRRSQAAASGPEARQADGHANTKAVRLAVLRAWLRLRTQGKELEQGQRQGAATHFEPPPHLQTPAARHGYARLLRGMVRHQTRLEAEAAHLSRGGLDAVEPEVLGPTLLGLYLLRIEGTPPHAAVNESVALATALGRGRARGWVNGVLRAATRLDVAAFEAELGLAERTSHPQWLVDRWRAYLGDAATEALCAANNHYAGAALRVESRRADAATVRERLHDADIAATPHPEWPQALWVEQLGPVLSSAPFREGLLYVQDLTSQLACAWLEPRLRGRVLDACAAPGGKLTALRAHLPQGAKQRFALTAAEPAAGRMARVRENLHRLRQPAVPLLRADAAHMPFADGAWDAVLADVPCSATGMIRKYPELKWRVLPEDLAQLTAAQAAILAEGARVLRPGGLLVYITCALLPEENEGQVDAFLAAHPGFSLESLRGGVAPADCTIPPGEMLTARGEMRLLPNQKHMGLYMALLRKRGEQVEGKGEG